MYIADIGLIKTSSVAFSGNQGALLENCVYNSLRSKAGASIYYFSTKSGGECDFIVDPHGDPSCIQVCWELNTDNQDREINGLLEALEFFNAEEGEILTYDTEDLILTRGKRIKVTPAWEWI